MKNTVPLLLALCLICRAELVRYEEANFSINIPAAWKKAEAPPAALAVFRSPDNSKGVSFMTMPISSEEVPTALKEMLAVAKEWAKKTNIPITGKIHEKVIDGVPFSVFSQTMPGKDRNVSVISAMAVTGQRGYSIEGFSGVSDATTDPEIAAMLESFRLLAMPSSPPAVDRLEKARPTSPANSSGGGQ